MNFNKLQLFINTFQDFKNSTTYQVRQAQTCFATVARRAIAESIANAPLSNEKLTGLIQMLKFECSNEIFEKYLRINVASEATRHEIVDAQKTCGHTGYTRAGKTGVSTLSQSQIDAVQKFLADAFQIDNIESAVQLVQQFELQNIPEIKSGVYSPWLHYINPSLFPILNNTYDDFLKWLEIEKSYSICLTELNKLKLVVNETSYAMLDSFAHTFEEATVKADTKNDTPGFFSSYDFYCLEKYAGKVKVKNNEDHEHTYRELRWTYDKVEHWARTVQSELFPNGKVELLKKPTNQGNYFEKYQWARIYPDVKDPSALALTVSIDTGKEFHVKIDTVWLRSGDRMLEKYEAFRGDYRNSSIVRILPAVDVFKLGWDGLVKTTTEILSELLPVFHSLQLELGLVTGDLSTLNNKPMNIPLNNIIYGPPGTGKTYSTIESAIKIANSKFDFPNSSNKIKDRELVKAEFDRLRKIGQIEFTTFHQSLSYEEFIEGIKPSTQDKVVQYNLENGIFKRMCNRALFEYYKHSQNQSLKSYNSFDELYNLFIENIEQRLVKGVVQLPQKSKDRYVKILSVVEDDLLVQGKTSANEVIVEKEKLRLLYNRYKGIDEIVNVLDDIRAVGRGLGWTSNYYGVFKELKRFESGLKPAEIKAASYSTIMSDEQIDHFLTSLPDKYAIENINALEVNNYVLIIDEINRGNVSQIFGELITLIEEDKRLGKPEAIRVLLPYSGEKFIVPPNVYIVGTMNTADRSVEALDTALRRRFSFEELMPNPALLKTTEDGIDLPTILSTINERIEILLDRDHTIGHSYFMKVKNKAGLRTAFCDCIIPLLKEYFYGDYGKIALVLGEGFVESRKPTKVKFAAKYEGMDDLTTPRFIVRPIGADFDIIKAIELLIPKIVPTPVEEPA